MKIQTDSFSLEIEDMGMAEQTANPADPDVRSTTEGENGLKILDSCQTNGHLRQITFNGVCYSQMCCGGQWLFFYVDRGGRRVWCTCNLGESWTVNCSGNNWIINCR